MTLCLAKYSALESLAAAAQPAHGLLALPRTEPFDYDAPSSKAVADAQRSLPFLTQPATFVLPDASYRRNLRGASFLICKHAAVPGALWNLRAPADKPRQRNRNPIPAASEAVQGLPGTSSPAFCLAQLGTELPPRSTCGARLFPDRPVSICVIAYRLYPRCRPHRNPFGDTRISRAPQQHRRQQERSTSAGPRNRTARLSRRDRPVFDAMPTTKDGRLRISPPRCERNDHSVVLSADTRIAERISPRPPLAQSATDPGI